MKTFLISISTFALLSCNNQNQNIQQQDLQTNLLSQEEPLQIEEQNTPLYEEKFFQYLDENSYILNYDIDNNRPYNFKKYKIYYSKIANAIMQQDNLTYDQTIEKLSNHMFEFMNKDRFEFCYNEYLKHHNHRNLDQCQSFSMNDLDLDLDKLPEYPQDDYNTIQKKKFDPNYEEPQPFDYLIVEHLYIKQD